MYVRARVCVHVCVLTQQVVVGVPLILESQSSVADMVQVLQPLKVGDGDAAGIQVHILQGATERLVGWSGTELAGSAGAAGGPH